MLRLGVESVLASRHLFSEPTFLIKSTELNLYRSTQNFHRLSTVAAIMRTSRILVGLATAVVIAAQSASELAAAIPACAKPALDEAATGVGCETTDYACICGPKKEELIVYASPKVVDTCGTEAAGTFLLISQIWIERH